MLNRQGRPGQVDAPEASAAGTFSGNRGLAVEEALIFEIGRTETTGVDLEEPAKFSAKLGRLARTAPLGLPVFPSPRPCATTCGFHRRTTASIQGCSRLAHAP